MGNNITTTIPTTLTGEEYRQMEEEIEIEQYRGMFNTSEVKTTIVGNVEIIKNKYFNNILRLSNKDLSSTGTSSSSSILYFSL